MCDSFFEKNKSHKYFKTCLFPGYHFDMMPQQQLFAVAETFLKTVKKFPTFNSKFAYAKAISNCRFESVSWNLTDQPCLTEMRCAKQKNIKGFEC